VSTRDTQRQRVYNAQHAAGRGREFETVAEMQRYVDRVTGSAWFRKHYGAKKITVTDGRSRRRAAAEITWGGSRRIKMPRHSRCERTILHEIAHIVAWTTPAHGEKFCRAYLLLVKRFMGKEPFEKMLSSFREHNVYWEGAV
jgi:putative metallohydrolase (TIGR04338 family)